MPAQAGHDTTLHKAAQLNPPVSSQLTLSQAVNARKTEFTKLHTARLRVGTWNVGSHSGTENDLGAWFVGGRGLSQRLSTLHFSENGDHSRGQSKEDAIEQEERQKASASTVPTGEEGLLPTSDDVGIYVLGLQEVVDINSATEAIRTTDSASKRFKKALEGALPKGYTLIAAEQLIGLLLLIYVSPTVLPFISSVNTTSVGTGLGGFLGNKGAVSARMVIGDSTRLVFVNSHLSAGATKADLERRNWDAHQVINRSRFEPLVDNSRAPNDRGDRIGSEDLAFWMGDMNYRIDTGVLPEDEVRRLLMRHTRNEYDTAPSRQRQKIDDELLGGTTTAASHGNGLGSSASATSSNNVDDVKDYLEARNDPASLQTTIDSILRHDELRQQMQTRKMFHDGWKEGPITFLPTYKYDVGSVGVFDSGEKRRGPSWTDRIIYRTRRGRLAHEDILAEEAAARVRDEAMTAEGLDKAADEERVLFDYDPDTDGEHVETSEEGQGGSARAPNAGEEQDQDQEQVTLEYYTAHQRVLSSDHKPLDAVFAFKFNAIVPKLRQKVQQEVAREIDRMENESQPILTVVVEDGRSDTNPELDGVHFGKIRYSESKSLSITLANTGRTAAVFGFAYQPELGGNPPMIAPQWLTVRVHDPSGADSGKGPSKERTTQDLEEWSSNVSGPCLLDPGDTWNIDLTLCVESRDTVDRLNAGQPLEAILVLRVKAGRDHFIPVRGTWQHSSHGVSLDRLVTIPEGGVRLSQLVHEREKSPQLPNLLGRSDGVIIWSAPREIHRLTTAVETLVERVVAEWAMLRIDVNSVDGGAGPIAPWNKSAGWPFAEECWTLDATTRRALRLDVFEALDEDRPFDDFLPSSLMPLHRLEIFADALLDFLAYLPDGIVTAPLWARLESEFFAIRERSSLSIEDRQAQVLDIFASQRTHSVSFVLLTSSIARIVQEVVSGSVAQADRHSLGGWLPASTKVQVKRVSLNQNPVKATKQLIIMNLATVFAEVSIRTESTGVRSQQRSAADAGNRRELFELFLDGAMG